MVETIIEELLSLMGYEPEASAREVGAVLSVEVSVRYGAGALIGSGGDGINALEGIVRRIVQKQIDTPARIVVDVNGYRRERAAELREEVREIANKVKRSGKTYEFMPMPARERRIVHLELASRADVLTESSGEGAARHVVIRVA